MINFPQDIFEQILFYVPQDLNGIDRETQRKTNVVFNYLLQSYIESPSIRRFIPHERNLSDRARVLRTANDIFRFGVLTGQVISTNVSSETLHSILDVAPLSNPSLDTQYWISLAHIVSSEGIVNGIRVLHLAGKFNKNLVRYTAVKVACERGHLPVVREMLGRRIIDDTFRGTALITASSNGHSPVVQTLLYSGEISPNERLHAMVRANRNRHLSTLAILALPLIPRIQFGGSAAFTVTNAMLPRSSFGVAIVVLIVAIGIFQIISAAERI